MKISDLDITDSINQVCLFGKEQPSLCVSIKNIAAPEVRPSCMTEHVPKSLNHTSPDAVDVVF